jgi:hypothetical protein
MLSVEEVYELNAISLTDTIANDLKAIPNPPNLANPLKSCSRFRNHLKWERQLPGQYVILSTPSLNSLKLDVSMQTLDTGEVVASLALLDCRATGLFINSNFVRMKNLKMKRLHQPVNVYNVDGTPNEAGKVSKVWETVLRYCDHSEHVIFAVTCLGKQNIILGLDWLREHNPEVDWQMNKVKMSRCLNHCRTCQNETNAK